MEPEGSLPCSQEPATGLLSLMNSLHTRPLYLRSILKLSFDLRLKFCEHFSSLLCVLLAHPAVKYVAIFVTRY
jgi:hypothetical protein